MSSPRRRRSAAAKRNANGRRRVVTILGEDPKAPDDRVAAQRQKRFATGSAGSDHRWKIAVATIGIEGAIAAAHSASLSDVVNNVLVGMFGARITPLGHDQFWQTIALMFVVGGTGLAYIVVLRRR